MSVSIPQCSTDEPAQPLTLALRIGFPYWHTQEAFDTLQAMLEPLITGVDELALFDARSNHAWTAPQAYAARMQRLGQRINALREMGIPRVGVNVLSTLGHANEAWSLLPPLPWQAMVGMDGRAAFSVACPNDQAFQVYIADKYRGVAASGPDFIWVDDDVRLHHQGVTWGCFCPTCLARFSQHSGQTWTHASLTAALQESAATALRQAWVAHVEDTLADLLTLIGQTVRDVDATIATGLMTTGPLWTTWNGMNLARWCAALGATKARPGGGFYQDATASAMLDKTLHCGLQRAALGPQIRDVQYEVENYPFQRLGKSATALVAECSLALAHGHQGVAFNMPGMLVCSPQDSEHLLARIGPCRPAWQAWVAHTANLPTAGLYPLWSRHLVASGQVSAEEPWPAGGGPENLGSALAPQHIGLPLASDAPGCGTLLWGHLVDALDDAALTDLLSGGVIMDAAALARLQARGLHMLAGAKVVRALDNGVCERFTDDPLHPELAGCRRDVRLEFGFSHGGTSAHLLACLGDDVRVLAEIEDDLGHTLGPAMTAYENHLGGRVVVMGYAPWAALQSVDKRRQWLAIADFISRDTLPVRIEDPVPLVPVVRAAGNSDRSGLLLLNAGLDVIESVTVTLRLAARRARLWMPGQEQSTVLPLSRHEGYTTLTLTQLQAWSVRMILLES